MSEKKPNNSLYKLTLAAFIAGSLIFHLAILWESRNYIADGHGDFIIFYTGAQIINDGKSKELFKIETQNAYQAKFNVPQLEWPLPFNHAPYELIPFLSLALLPYPIAHAIWSGINLIFLVIILRILLPYVDSQHSFFIGAAVLAWFPTMEAFRSGQDSIMSTLLLLAVFITLKRKRDGWAGFFLALGLYKPQLVLPMAGVFLVMRRWTSLGVFSITGGILAALSLVMVGWQGAFDLLSIVRLMEDFPYIIHPENMPNIRGLSRVLSDIDTLELILAPLAITISIGLYALCLYLWWGEWDVPNTSFDLKFALTIVTTLLVSYHLYAHDLFPLTISLILFFRCINLGAITLPVTANAFFLLLLILFLPVIPRFLIQYSKANWAVLSILFFYVTLTVEIVGHSRIELEEK